MVLGSASTLTLELMLLICAADLLMLDHDASFKMTTNRDERREKRSDDTKSL